MSIRRIVTGEDASGAHVFVSDAALEPLRAAALRGADMYYVWGADERVSVPNDGAQPPWRQHFPPVDGFRFVVFGLAPATMAGHDGPLSEADLREAEEKFPGLLTTFDERHPGVHASQSVDLAIVLRGEVLLELDDGERRHLHTGDVVVQNGTRHAWTNPGDAPALVGFVLLGAEPARSAGPA